LAYTQRYSDLLPVWVALHLPDGAISPGHLFRIRPRLQIPALLRQLYGHRLKPEWQKELAVEQVRIVSASAVATIQAVTDHPRLSASWNGWSNTLAAIAERTSSASGYTRLPSGNHFCPQAVRFTGERSQVPPNANRRVLSRQQAMMRSRAPSLNGYA